MEGVTEKILACSGLHQLAGVHQPHLLGHPRHHPQIVGDEEHSHPPLGLEPGQQVQHLGLDGHVQGSGGLVRHQQPGLARQGHGDHHPLAHATGELKGVGRQTPGGIWNAHRLQQRPGGGIPGSPPKAKVARQHFPYLASYGEHRIEAGG
jgi:hypothetical protein